MLARTNGGAQAELTYPTRWRRPQADYRGSGRNDLQIIGSIPLMSIATRTGDDGKTSLLYGQRVSKDHPQIETVGAFDELNAALGLAKANSTSADQKAELERCQHELVALMGELACAESDSERYAASAFVKIDERSLERIDSAVSAIEAKKISFKGWATPGANLEAASLDVARTVARRAERRLVALPNTGRSVRPVLIQYVNRLSDLLWLMARDAESL